MSGWLRITKFYHTRSELKMGILPPATKIPQNNPETNVPNVIDGDDDTDIPGPAETNAAWTRGGRLRAKLSSIHISEPDDPDSSSKLSSTSRSDSAVEYFSSWISISGMKEVESAPSGQTTTMATISSGQGRRSPDSTPAEQGEQAQAAMSSKVSKPADKGGALRTNSSSWQNAH